MRREAKKFWSATSTAPFLRSLDSNVPKNAEAFFLFLTLASKTFFGDFNKYVTAEIQSNKQTAKLSKKLEADELPNYAERNRMCLILKFGDD
jgi:hypothetical protein